MSLSLRRCVAVATKFLREEGGRRPETCSRWRRIYSCTIFGLFYTIQLYLGIECIVFCGGVACFNVFCVLVTYPPGRRPGGEFLAVQGTATELRRTSLCIGCCPPVLFLQLRTQNRRTFLPSCFVPVSSDLAKPLSSAGFDAG
jgi:hypothetical protein